MKGLILAAGYATRLRPLTDTTAKPLLPVGGRPIVDWLLDKFREVEAVAEVHLVTTARYAPDFRRWAEGKDVVVHDDGTSTNDDRLGAIGDIQFTVERAGIEDDLLVVAGDNLFDYSLAEMVAFWRGKGVASAVAALDVGDLELAKRYGVISIDDDGRIRSFVEKPEQPESTLAATAAYLYHREHVKLVERYLADGNPPDQPGNLVAWLHRREPVYAFPIEGGWFDVGDREQLLAADNRLRLRAGLPARDTYSLQS
jgi:glucose-1-phosphate thymidylyltransferase